MTSDERLARTEDDDADHDAVPEPPHEPPHDTTLRTGDVLAILGLAAAGAALTGWLTQSVVAALLCAASVPLASAWGLRSRRAPRQTPEPTPEPTPERTISPTNDLSAGPGRPRAPAPTLRAAPSPIPIPTPTPIPIKSPIEVDPPEPDQNPADPEPPRAQRDQLDQLVGDISRSFHSAHRGQRSGSVSFRPPTLEIDEQGRTTGGSWAATIVDPSAERSAGQDDALVLPLVSISALSRELGDEGRRPVVTVFSGDSGAGPHAPGRSPFSPRDPFAAFRAARAPTGDQDDDRG